MSLLGIETSCDETSVAVVDHGRVLSNVVSSQIFIHAEYGGVVPELATREHLKNLLPLARVALSEAGCSVSSLDAVAATQGPGLPNALLIGFTFGQAVAQVLGKPFFGINHHEAHLYSPWISGPPLVADFSKFQPSVALIVSGGHTLLVLVEGEQQHRVLGSTLDDAAGECFDKTAKLMGLPYPGGPEMDRLAAEGNPRAYQFPRPLIHDPSDDFSFAGLKTSVRYFLQKNPDILEDRKKVCDLCASVQEAITEVLVEKTIRAAMRHGVKWVTAAGGVTCNRRLRAKLLEATSKKGLTLCLAEKILCTDNAAMIAVLAERKMMAGVPPTPMDAGILPSWSLGSEIRPLTETRLGG